MADLTVTIQNNHVQRVIDAFTAYANQGTLPGETPIVVDQKWVEAYLKRHVQTVVREHELDAAHKAAIEGITLPPDIT